MISLLGFVLAVCAAIAWYAGSPHCMWSALRGYPRAARIAGPTRSSRARTCGDFTLASSLAFNPTRQSGTKGTRQAILGPTG